MKKIYSHPINRKCYDSKLDFIKSKHIFAKARNRQHAKQLFMNMSKDFCKVEQDRPMYINENSIDEV